MSQISFADAEYAGKRKKTRREVFLEEMERVLSNLWMVRKQLMAMTGVVRPKAA